MTLELKHWHGAHIALYNAMAMHLQNEPITESPSEYMRKRLPRLFALSPNKPGAHVIPPDGGKIVHRLIDEGEITFYWDGSALNKVPFNWADSQYKDYYAVAKKLQDLAAVVGGDPIILDLGCGSGATAIALRDIGFTGTYVGIDFMRDAISVAQSVAEALKLTDLHWIGFDIKTAVLHGVAGTAALTRQLLYIANGRKIILTTRYAMHGFYDRAEQVLLFDYLLRDLKISAGVHVEFSGYLTTAFHALNAKFSGTLKRAPQLVENDDDTLAYIAARPGVKVYERVELWPHFLSTRFPSYLSWVRA